MQSRRKRGKIKTIYFFLAVVWLFPLLFVACASPKIKTYMLVPAKSNEATKLRRITVLPFSGQAGDQVSADIEALLVGIHVGGEPYFKVIERTAIKKILKEHSLQMAGLLEEKTAVKVGKLVGAEGIIVGTVTQNAIENKNYMETRSKCSERDKDRKCVKRIKYNIRCTERNAYFSFTPKIISVSTGLIVASRQLSGYSYDRDCRDSNRSLVGRTELINTAKRQAIDKFRKLVAPTRITVEIPLLKKNGTKPPSTAKKKIVSGIDWAKQGRMDRACEYWDESYKLHPQGYAIHYLLGVCAEVAGNLREAFNYYKTADRFTNKPVKEINEALSRVKVRIEKGKKLEEQIKKLKAD